MTGDALLWRPRQVHDLMFRIDGFGWYPPELRDGIGFRWSGPGRLASLRIPFRCGGAGRGEIHLVEPVPGGVEVFLNGHPMTIEPRSEGAMEVLGFAWPAAAMAGQDVAELWIAVPETRAEGMPSPDAPGGRRLGVAVSCVVLEPGAAEGRMPEGATDAEDALPLLIGRRWMARHLAVEAAGFAFTPAEDGEALEVIATALRLAALSLPRLAWRLRLGGDGEAGLVADWRAADNPGLALPVAGVVVAAPGDDGLALDGLDGLASAFDRVALAALLRDLIGPFRRWLGAPRGVGAVGDVPGGDVPRLAAWQVALHRARAAATRSLAALAAESDLPAVMSRVPAGSIFGAAGAAARAVG